MINVSLALPLSHNEPPHKTCWFKRRPLSSLHAGMTEPIRVSPAEAVVYLN